MRRILILCLLCAPLATTAATYEERGVAAILMGEAWSDGVRGMTAVADVIHQRSLEKRETPLTVISRRHAFSSLNGTTLDKLIAKFSVEPDFEKALVLAKEACENPEQLPDLTNNANHYTRATERPYWAKGHRPVAVVGRHAFYKLDHY